MAFEMAQAYPWIKSLHVVSVILWMGAQFLLPALLAAHGRLPGNSAGREELLGLQRWLVGWVLNPAMVAAFVFGGLLAAGLVDDWTSAPAWLVLKLGLVLVLAALHGRLLRQYWRGLDGRSQWPAGRYGWVQKLDLALLAGVVALVVARPFP